MGCGASTVAPTADAGGGTSLTRQLTAAIDRTSKSTRVSTLQREAIEEADALLPEYMRLGVAVEWLREFVREHKIEKETTREVSTSSTPRRRSPPTERTSCGSSGRTWARASSTR